MKKVHDDEFSKAELVELAETLKVEVGSRDTKTALVEKINKVIEGLASSEDTSIPSKAGDTSDSVEIVEESALDVEVVKESKVHKGFHPITGKLVD